MVQYNIHTKEYSKQNKDLYEVVMLADKNGLIMNNSNIINDINLVSANRFINKIGAVPALAQNTNGSIWDTNDKLINWDVLGTAHIKIECFKNNTLSNLDVGKKITIFGLNSNFEEVQIEITITAQSFTSNLAAELNLIRINDVMVDSSNLTDIVGSVSANNVFKILIGKGRTLNSNFTIPKGFTGYLLKGSCSCSNSSDATVDMYVRFFGHPFRIGHSFEISGYGGQYTYDFSLPLVLPEKTDIEVRGTTRSNNARITTAYDLILIENEL